MKTSLARKIPGLLLAVLLPCAVSAQGAPLACDVDADRDVDRVDIAAINAARNQPANGPNDPRDFDRDGIITTTDARACTVRCTLPQCAIPTANRAPVANAGADQVAFPGVTVTLNGTASTDPDGNALTYRWTLAARPPGSAAVLANATGAMPTFVPDRAGDYRVDLVVNDGALDSAVDSVVVTTENVAPVANAGPDQLVARGATVTLDGTGSTDANGDPLTYQWTFVAFAGATPPALLSGGARPTFVAAAAGTYRVQLVVNDGRVSSTADFVVVTTEPPPNTPPVANAGADQRVALGALVVLDGSGSNDADGDPLAYRWSLTSRPAGSSAALAGANGVSPTLTADRAGNYVVQLIVNDGTVDSPADTVLVSTTNTPPVANAGADQTVTEGDTVALNGIGSSDADGDPLTFAWSFSSSPGATPPAIAGANTPTPSFVAAAAGLYVVQLVVNDGTVDSAPDTASITVEVRANRSPSAVNDAATTAEEASVTIPVLANDSDPDGDPLTVTAVSQPANGSAATNGTTVTFTPAANFDGQTSFTYSISDGRGGTSSATVLLTVTPVNDAPVARADAASTTSGTPVDVAVLANDEDVDGDTLTIQSVGTPSSGTAAIVGNQVRYTPAPGFAGQATFTYTVSDGRGGTATATVTVTVGGLPSLSIGDASVNEGDAGTTLANFAVTLSAASGASVTVAYATADGTASASSDYGAASGTLTFAPGETTKTVAVVVNGDATVEPTETFVVNLSAPVNATLADAQGQGTIVNDDQTVLVTIEATTPTVPEEEPGAAVFTVSRSGPTAAPLTVALTRAGTATPGADFAGIAASVTIPAGQASATVAITPADDALVEGDETVVLTIAAGAGYAAGTPSAATVTIVENDFTPTVTIAATTATAPEQGPGTGVFTVIRTGGGGSDAAPLTVALTRTGTATPGADFAGIAASVTIPANATSATVTIAPTDDALVEGGETVVLTLGANAAYTIGTPSAATVTIVDDDFAPTVTIAATTPTVPEQGPGSGVFTVTRAGGGGSDAAPLTVALTRTGTATPGADFAGIAVSVTIPANATSATVAIAPTDDALVEGDETVVLTIGANASYTIGTPNSATVTIVENDFTPTVAITGTTPTVPEQGPGTGVFTVTRAGGGGSDAAPLTVAFTRAGTATPGADFANIATSVTIPANAATATVTIAPVNDTLVEGAETVVLSLAANAAYTIGTPSSATVTIVDDDLPAIVLTPNPLAVTAGETATLTVTLGGIAPASPVTVALSSSAPANATVPASVVVPAGQSSATVTVTGVAAGSTTITASASGYAAGAALVNVAAPALPAVTVTTSDASGAEAGTEPATFTIARSGSTAALLNVFVQLGGTATADTDYGRPGGSAQGGGVFLYQIPAGSTSATFSIAPVDDALVEGSETVVVTAQANASYTVGTPASTTLTIADDDLVPTVAVTTSDANGTEAGSDPATFTLTRSGGGGSDAALLNVFVRFDGTATPDTDYGRPGGSAQGGGVFLYQIPAGSPSATFGIVPVDDALVEGSETVVVTVQANASYTVGAPASTTVTIGDSEAAPLLSAADAARNEGDVGNAPLVFTVTLSVPSATTVTVDYATADGTATAGSDYLSASGTLTFAPGTTSQTVSVQIVGDTTVEPSETFQLQLSNATGGATVFAATATGTITNDDPVRLVTIADVSQNEGNAGTTAFLFAVRLDAPAIGPVTVDYQTVAGSAVAGSDFVATSGTVTFNAGEVERTIAVDVVGDATQEGDETFQVQLSNPNANGALVDSVGLGTIVNDDVTITLTFDPTFLQVPIGATRQLTVRRNVAAGAGGAVVTLTSVNPAIATVPATVTIPEGQTSVAFTVTAAGTIGQQTQVTAGGAGATTNATATVALTGGAVVVPAQVRVGLDLQQAVNVSLPAAPPSATTITVSVPANAGVTLSTSPAVEGSTSLTIPNVAGSGSYAVYVQGRTLGATTTVTASSPNYADGTFPVTVDPSGYAFYAVSSATETQAAPGTRSIQVWSIRLVPGTLEFSDWQSLRGGRTATIGFTSSVPAAGTVTPSVTIAAGSSSASVTFSALAPNPATNPDTRVSIVQPAGFTATSSATFNARTQVDFELVGAAINAGAARDVGRGLQVFNNGALGSNSPTPVAVTLSVPPGSGVLLAPNSSTVGTETLVIPGVTSSFSYYVQGGAVTSAPVTITASAPGYSNGTTTANVTPSGFAFYAVGEDPTTVDLTSPRQFQIWSVRLQPGTLAFVDWQQAMPGTAYPIVVTNSNPAAGTVTNSPINFAGGASSVSATFQPAAGTPNTTTLAIVQPSGFSATSSAVFNARTTFGVTVNTNVQRIGVATIDASATEAGTPPGVAVYRITRTGPGLASAVNVSWTMSGSAVQSTDYTLSVGGTNVNSSVQIPANQTSVDVVLTPVKDTLLDDGETAVMTLSASSVYIVDPATPATVTITDDPTVVSVAAIDATATEAGQTTATFRLTRSGGNVAATQHVEFVVGGTAAISSDYAASGSGWAFWQSPDVYRATFPAGSATVDVTITPQLDQLPEPAETVTLTLRASTAASSGYQIATPAAVSATIADDPPVVAVAVVDGAAAEATLDAGVLRFTRSGGNPATALQVLFSLAGTATLNTDYAATGGNFGFWRSAAPPIYRVQIPGNATQVDVTFAPVRDNVVETGGETVVVAIVANEVGSQGYDIASAGAGPVTVTIADDPPVVTLTAIDATAAEQPLDTATLRFARTGGNPTLSLQAEFQIGGTATLGADYTGSGSNFALLASGPPAVYRVIFPASAATTDATITPVNDTTAEPTETATFTLVPSPSATVGTPNAASITIASNE